MARQKVRHCKKDGCTTILNMYNLEDYCYYHTPPKPYTNNVGGDKTGRKYRKKKIK